MHLLFYVREKTRKSDREEKTKIRVRTTRKYQKLSFDSLIFKHISQFAKNGTTVSRINASSKVY